MIPTRKLVVTLALGVAVLAGGAIAGGHNLTPEQQALKARKAHMGLYAFNLGTIGAMVKGEMEYDADAAGGAAGNIAALAGMNQAGYWLPGTDSDSLEGSRALPKLWDSFPDVMEKAQAVNTAAQNLASVAGGGDVAAIGPALGALGQACNACHKAYQQPR